MCSSNTSSEHKRTNLILLRVWQDDIDEDGGEQEHGNKSVSPSRRWHGNVQKTVSGEERSFAAKEDLMGVLEAMIYNDRTAHSRPRGKTSSEVTPPEGGNNPNEGTRADRETGGPHTAVATTVDLTF